jgi:hypothetical protein
MTFEYNLGWDNRRARDELQAELDAAEPEPIPTETVNIMVKEAMRLASSNTNNTHSTVTGSRRPIPWGRVVRSVAALVLALAAGAAGERAWERSEQRLLWAELERVTSEQRLLRTKLERTESEIAQRDRFMDFGEHVRVIKAQERNYFRKFSGPGLDAEVDRLALLLQTSPSPEERAFAAVRLSNLVEENQNHKSRKILCQVWHTLSNKEVALREVIQVVWPNVSTATDCSPSTSTGQST